MRVFEFHTVEFPNSLVRKECTSTVHVQKHSSFMRLYSKLSTKYFCYYIKYDFQVPLSCYTGFNFRFIHVDEEL